MPKKQTKKKHAFNVWFTWATVVLLICNTVVLLHISHRSCVSQLPHLWKYWKHRICSADVWLCKNCKIFSSDVD